MLDLALQDAFERAIEGPDHPAGARRDSGDHNEEAHLVHRAPEAAEPAGDEIADEAGAEPQAHRRRDHACRRDLRNQLQADGGEIELAGGDDDEIGEQPPPCRRIAGRRSCRARHDQIGQGDAEAAERHLGDGRRLHSALLLPCPECDGERCEGEYHKGVKGLEPGHRDLALPNNEIDGPVGVVASPQRDGVALLLVGGPEHRDRQKQRDQRQDRAPFVAVERLLVESGGLGLVHLVRRQHGRGVEVESERDRHPDAGGGKSIMPAQLLAERAADEGREERTDIDTDVKDRIGAVAPMVARRVEAADLGRDVGLEGAIAENEREERQQEQRFECHHEMADRHQPGAKDHGATLTEQAIRKPASKEGGQINKPSIETINLRCEGLHAERAEYAFEHAAHCAEPDEVVMAGQQQVLHHVKDEQRAHSVIGKALPHLGGEQEGQPARMAEEIALGSNAIGA